MSGSALHWFKSSYSNDSGGECLEVAHAWRKSTYSDGGGGQCLEVAGCPHAVHVRDSKAPGLPHLVVPGGSWGRFVAWVR
ncbi:DUF397 domain-containing protein [Streptomyces endophyticus]|uniref:DUF397 domain-containing protein n=1 Tax=Streptomyces endophyticus TaxID=714166 RepID=A0ABU6FJ03_9ACTN|nr:DUF397 domain-containing protein [Streptomyces endophyticus]MEB8344033.1 DUF397 domain-containing protein [Streptomyces endophyticus]